MTTETLKLANEIKERIDRYQGVITLVHFGRPSLIRKEKYLLRKYTPTLEVDLDDNDVLHLIRRNEDKIKVLEYLLKTLTDDNYHDYCIELKNLIEIGTSKRILDIVKEEENDQRKSD